MKYRYQLYIYYSFLYIINNLVLITGVNVFSIFFSKNVCIFVTFQFKLNISIFIKISAYIFSYDTNFLNFLLLKTHTHIVHFSTHFTYLSTALNVYRSACLLPDWRAMPHSLPAILNALITCISISWQTVICQ